MTSTRRWHIASLMGAVGLCTFIAAHGGAAPLDSVPAPAVTREQVVAGEAAYKRACAVCHGADLKGPDAPALVGPDIMSGYHTVSGLYDYIAVSMPPQAPGKLPREEFVAIVAYILAANGACMGDRALMSDPVADKDLSLLSLAGKCGPDAKPDAEHGAEKKKVPQAYTWGRKLPSVSDLP